jgi:hypothetical protein
MHATHGNHRKQPFTAKRGASIRIALLAISLGAGTAQATAEYLIVGDTQGGASHCQYSTVRDAHNAALDNGPDLSLATDYYDNGYTSSDDSDHVFGGGYD